MKNLFASLVLFFIFLSGTFNIKAQTYKTGFGLLVDVGNGATLVGPHVKHFFSQNSAGEFSVLFGGGLTTVQLVYQYNSNFPGADGLNWYVGVGPAVSFANSNTEFSAVPLVGMDFKIPNIPLDLFADWRPRIFFYDNVEFLAARFGLGVRFTL